MRAVRFADGVKPLLVPIDKVRQHPDNPNNGDDENLVESIQVNGFVTAVTVDEATGYIIAGNTRYRALLALGATQIPVIWAKWDESDGAVRYMVGDNASSRRAVMDDAALLQLMNQLSETELGLAGTSITQSEYEAMLTDKALTPPPEGMGFGAGPAPLGLHQIIITFKDDPDERDAVFAELTERYDNVRTEDL